MRSIPVVFFAVLLLPAEAAAFTGREHRCISESALALATEGEPEKTCELLPAKSNPCDRKYQGGKTFGDLTRVVDWYQNPTDPKRFPPYDWKILQRRTRILRRYLATHNNVKHFQQDAVDAYASAHEQALCARNLRDALWYEAMALHYLQDFFSPGHIVTPRSGSNDVISGSLHDRFSRRGARIIIDQGKLPDIAVKILKDKTLPEHIFGDGRLDDKARDFLIALSAASIREVVDKQHQGVPGTELTLCFHTRSANAETPSKIVEVQGSARGPYASLQLHPTSDPACNCEPEAIARYEFKDDKDLKEGFYSLWGFYGSQLFSIRGGARRVTDFGMLILAKDPKGKLRIREGDDECGKETFQSRLTAGAMVHYTNVEGARYLAHGLHMEFSAPWKRTELSVYGGYVRYRHDSRTDWRPEVGAKFGVGLDVINVIVAVERTHTIDGHGNIQQEYAVMPGLEMFISPTWLETAAKWLGDWIRH